jgi:hypothetical protein
MCFSVYLFIFITMWSSDRTVPLTQMKFRIRSLFPKQTTNQIIISKRLRPDLFEIIESSEV